MTRLQRSNKVLKKHYIIVVHFLFSPAAFMMETPCVEIKQFGLHSYWSTQSMQIISV